VIGQHQSAAIGAKIQKSSVASERAKLGFLAGTFTTETVIPSSKPSPNGATGKGTSTIAWGLDSMFLLINDESVNPMFGQYKGHGVLGYDPQEQQFVLSMFNNFGDRPSYKGNFVGDTLVLATKVPLPGHPFDQKILWYKDGNAVKMKVFNDMGNGFTPTLEQTAVPVSQGVK
jgi:hypothetical protein